MRRLRQKLALHVLPKKPELASSDSALTRSTDFQDGTSGPKIIQIPKELAAILPVDISGRKNKQQLGKSHPDYSKGIVLLLELFQEEDWAISAVAEKLQISTGSLSKLCIKDPKLKDVINKERQKRSLKPLR